ncbi:MBL fold metallo-hydrolase [Spongiibacter nanhainus]|uniref:MBL fold metallo-hydrolase n=1 Tax=Spongiibacter nanhainus TaxID=2794344 RepID=UPI00235492FA|nr:MBL fold metallo-hydrolase [Spongiibacter nanhainus]
MSSTASESGLKCGVVPVTAFQQNCSILQCAETKKLAVVDPGGDLDRIEAGMQQMGGELEVIFLTHGHMDHCAAADVMRQKYGVKIIGPEKADKFWIDQLPENCRMMGFPHADPFTPDQWLEDGDTVQLGAQTLQVIHCPGHTPGHVVFYHQPSKLAIVGDVLFQGSIGRTDFPMSDHGALISSIKDKLWPLGDDITFIPGHGPTSTFGQEKQTNPFVGSRYG